MRHPLFFGIFLYVALVAGRISNGNGSPTTRSEIDDDALNLKPLEAPKIDADQLRGKRASSNAMDPTFWANRGRRSENQKLLVREPENIEYVDYIEPSIQEKRDKNVFWGNRGKRYMHNARFEPNALLRQLERMIVQLEEEYASLDCTNRSRREGPEPFWGNRGRRSDEPNVFWGNRGRRSENPFWVSRGKKDDLNKGQNRGKKDPEDPMFWGNRGKKDQAVFWGNRGRRGEPVEEMFWGSRGKRNGKSTHRTKRDIDESLINKEYAYEDPLPRCFYRNVLLTKLIKDLLQKTGVNMEVQEAFKATPNEMNKNAEDNQYQELTAKDRDPTDKVLIYADNVK